jgi:tetratricopeptide (TPR) repeat protein
MDARSPERGQYSFVQALIREVAYNTLSKKDRKKLHLSAARYFESLGSDEIAGALASHYLAAHANSAEGAEADALAGQAKIALKAAASRASSLGSFAQAVHFIEQALTVTSDAAEEADLREQAAFASRTSGRYEKAEQLQSRAVELRRDLPDRVALLNSISELGYIVSQQFKADEALELLETSLAQFSDLVNEPALAEVKVMLARSLHSNNDNRRALELVDAALETAELSDDVAVIARGMLVKSNVLIALGRRREGVGLTRTLRDVAAENGLTDLLLRASGNLSGHLSEIDLAESLALNKEVGALARRAGHRDMWLNNVGNAGYVGYLAGEWDFGLSEIDAALADEVEPRDALHLINNSAIIRVARGESIDEDIVTLEKMGKEMSGALWRLFVADPDANAGMATGDLGRAKKGFATVAESDPSQAPEFYYRAARPALWARDVAEARRLAGLMAGTGGYGPLVAARKATLAAGLAALDGRSAEAMNLYREALKGWRGTGAVWDEALTGIDMAELLDSNDPEVAEAVASTRVILERLRAKPYLERLEAAVARDGVAAPSKTRARGAATREVAVAE